MNAKPEQGFDATGETVRGGWTIRPGAGEGTFVLRFTGTWTMDADLPPARRILADLERAAGIRRLVVEGDGLERWDSRLPAVLVRIAGWAATRDLALHCEGFPEGVGRLLALATAGGGPALPEAAPPPGALATLGRTVTEAFDALGDALALVGELALAFGRLLRGRVPFEWRDLLLFVQRAGADALPIVGLVGVLVGIILAFVGTTQLARVGGEIYVANLVTLGMAREMGALMAAIIMAGRTGAAYAAELGSMEAGEEIDALRALGVPPVDHLVLPRVLALALTMPLLALYADAIGILGGALSATLLSDITLLQYYEQSLSYLSLADFGAGLGKAALFGWLVAFAGCFTGMRSGRSAAGVGRATTGAVVLGIVLIVLGDALMTVVYYVLDI